MRSVKSVKTCETGESARVRKREGGGSQLHSYLALERRRLWWVQSTRHYSPCPSQVLCPLHQQSKHHSCQRWRTQSRFPHNHAWSLSQRKHLHATISRPRRNNHRLRNQTTSENNGRQDQPKTSLPTKLDSISMERCGMVARMYDVGRM